MQKREIVLFLFKKKYNRNKYAPGATSPALFMKTVLVNNENSKTSCKNISTK